jgi:hypothetical protein
MKKLLTWMAIGIGIAIVLSALQSVLDLIHDIM